MQVRQGSQVATAVYDFTPRHVYSVRVRRATLGGFLALMAAALMALFVMGSFAAGEQTHAPQAPAVRKSPVVTPTATPATQDDWPAGKDGFTVQLASLKSLDEAHAVVREAKARGIAAGVLVSSGYPRLTGGYYVVYGGVFATREQARAHLEQGQALRADAFVQWISAAGHREPRAAAKNGDSAKHPAQTTEVPKAASPQSVTGYHAKDAPTFSVEYPAAWGIVHDGLSYGPFERTEWRAADADKSNVSVDYAPNYQLSPQEAAERARVRVQASSDYEEVLFVATTAHGAPAWKWIYRLGDVAVAHYFVEACGSAYAVLGTTSMDAFAALEPTFSHVADSLAPKCTGGAQTPPPQTGFGGDTRTVAKGAGTTTDVGDNGAPAALDRLTRMLRDIMGSASNVTG